MAAVLMEAKRNGVKSVFRFEPGTDCLGMRQGDGTTRIIPGVYVNSLNEAWDYLDRQGYKPVRTLMEA